MSNSAPQPTRQSRLLVASFNGKQPKSICFSLIVLTNYQQVRGPADLEALARLLFKNSSD